MAVPPNITPSDAVVITATPFLAVLDVTDAPTGNVSYTPSCVAAPYHAVWYRYTAQTGDDMIAVLATVDDLVAPRNYTPTLSIWTGTLPTLTQYTIGSQHFCGSGAGGFWFDVPVTAGTEYYVQIVDGNNTLPLGVNLQFELRRQPTASSPIGSILIPDDTIGFPGVVLSAADGSITRVVSLPAGELGDTLPTGEVCVEDKANPTTVQVRSSALDPIATVDFGAGESILGIRSDRDATFYVLTTDGATATTLHTVSALGVVGATTWIWPPPNDPYLYTPSLDGTILYYCRSNDSRIRRWDLVNDIALPDLAIFGGAFVSVGLGDDFTGLDGSVFFAVLNISSPTAVEVRRYSALGALVNTYTVPQEGAVGDFVALDHFSFRDATTFMIWGLQVTSDSVPFGDGTQSLYRTVLIADGSTVSTIGPVATAGSSGGFTVADAPFFISNSCPLLILTQALPVLLAIAKSHTGTFTRGGSGAFTVTVSNPIGGAATSGVITVTETIPTGFVLGAMSGTGWTCVANVCTRSDVLDPGDSYPPILVTVLVDADAPDTVCNDVEVDTESGDPVETTDCVAIVDMVTVTYPARRLRRFALPFDQNKWIFIHRLEFIMQTGVGLISGQGSDPVVMMRLSRDGGETFGPEREMSIGKMGAYTWRVFTNRLGRARNPVVELTVSDPVMLSFLQATVDIESGTS